MRTSYSALSTFNQCPQRYKFKYIDKLHEPKTKEQLFGTHIHDCLKFMFMQDPLFPTLDQVLEYFLIHFPTEQFRESELEIYKKQGERMLRNFYLKHAPWNFVVVDLESRFEVVLEDPETGKIHILAGIMDRIDKLPDDTYEIIDYKTQKRLPSQEKADHDLQLSLYAMGLQKRWPHITPEKIKLSLQFLKHDEKLSTTRTAEDFKKTESGTLETIQAIENRSSAGGEFEPIVSPLCDFCGYKPLCPAWKHLYRNVKAEEIDGTKIADAMQEYFTLREEKKKAETRLKELGIMITRYLELEEIDRIFSDQGIIAKRKLEKYAYDFEKIREILEPLGKWQDVLKADEARLRKILGEVPSWAREEIKKARSLVHASHILTVTKNRKSLNPNL